MIYKVIRFLSQGGYPGPEKLTALKKEGVTHLLNVSGIDLFALYPAPLLEGFKIVQFGFKDIFSIAPLPGGSMEKNGDDALLYLKHSDETERQAFFAAVSTLAGWLEEGRHSHVFCQQGIGRSPCVVMSALLYHYRPLPAELEKTLKFMNPAAVLSQMSYAASDWFLQQMEKRDADG